MNKPEEKGKKEPKGLLDSIQAVLEGRHEGGILGFGVLPLGTEDGITTIPVRKTTHAKLEELKLPLETFDGLVRRLIQVHGQLTQVHNMVAEEAKAKAKEAVSSD